MEKWKASGSICGRKYECSAGWWTTATFHLSLELSSRKFDQQQFRPTPVKLLSFFRLSLPMLQSSVRNEVMATSHVTDEWMTLMEMSSLNCYIVRRYIATPSGVLRIYPGSLMDKAFDPTRRQWWGLLWRLWRVGGSLFFAARGGLSWDGLVRWKNSYVCVYIL